jgi:hypothetical protein
VAEVPLCGLVEGIGYVDLHHEPDCEGYARRVLEAEDDAPPHAETVH